MSDFPAISWQEQVTFCNRLTCLLNFYSAS